MRKTGYSIIGAMLLVMTCFLAQGNAAEVTVEIGTPPQIVIPAEPDVILVPDTEVYYIPDIKERVVFYNGRWYRTYKTHWFVSNSYNGPWVYVEVPPGAVAGLPMELKSGKRMHYKEFSIKFKKHED